MQTINEKVFSILKGFGLQIAIFSATGDQTIDPAQGVRFFCLDPNLLITIENEVLTLNRSSATNAKLIDTISEQLKHAVQEFMYDFNIKQFGRSIQPKDFSFQAKFERIKANEQESHMSTALVENFLGKLYGRVKTSYQMLGEVKITYRHRVPVNETAPQTRIRNIREITLEHAGQKYAFPVVHVDGARAMARHLHEGGMFGDIVGKYIVETSTDYKKLQEYTAYVKASPVLLETNALAFEAVQNKLQTIKESLRTFAKTKDYEAIKEQYAIQCIQEIKAGKLDALRNDLTVKYFDETLESVLPLINNILQEKEQHDARLIEASRASIFITREPVVSSTLTFESDRAEMAYLLSEASMCMENTDLSAYFVKLSEKLQKGKDLNELEVDIVKEAIKNLQRRVVNEDAPLEQTECDEDAQTEDTLVPTKHILADDSIVSEAIAALLGESASTNITEAKTASGYKLMHWIGQYGDYEFLLSVDTTREEVVSILDDMAVHNGYENWQDALARGAKCKTVHDNIPVYTVDPVEEAKTFGQFTEATKKYQPGDKVKYYDQNTRTWRHAVITGKDTKNGAVVYDVEVSGTDDADEKYRWGYENQIREGCATDIDQTPEVFQEAKEEDLYIVYDGAKGDAVLHPQFSGSRDDCKFEVSDMRRQHPRGSRVYAIKRFDPVADAGLYPNPIPNPNLSSSLITDDIDADVTPETEATYEDILKKYGFRFVATNYASNKKIGDVIFDASGKWSLDLRALRLQSLNNHNLRATGQTPQALNQQLSNVASNQVQKPKAAVLLDQENLNNVAYDPIRLYPEDEDRDCFTAKLSKDGNVWTSRFVFRLGLWREHIQSVLKGKYQSEFDNRSYVARDISDVLSSIQPEVDEVFVIDFCRELEDEELTEAGENPNAFYAVIKDGPHTWVAQISSEDGGTWSETTVEGEPGYGFGTAHYVAHAKPIDIVNHLYGDYQEVWGPFFQQPSLSEYLDENLAGAALKVGSKVVKAIAPHVKDLAKTAVDAAKPAVSKAAASAAGSVANRAFDKLSGKLSTGTTPPATT